MEGRPEDPNPSEDDCGVAHSSSHQGCELAEQSGAASSRSDASSCRCVDASYSPPPENFQHACTRPHTTDTCFLPVVDDSFCSSQVPNAHRVHFGPIPLEYKQRQLEEHEHHPSCSSLTKDSQNDNCQDKVFLERQAKVQITMQEARERISQLIRPRQEDKQSHLLERLMQKVENRKIVQNLAVILVAFYKKVRGWTPWRNSLKEIEGKFGSAVLLTFVFLRFVLFLNAILTVLWIVAIVIPFLIGPPKSFSWVHFFDVGFKSFFQGNGLEKSWIYYGGYIFRSGEQTGWYKTAYMYPCTIIASVLISWMAILTRIARRLTVSSKILISGSEVTHPFCTLVFGSWDFGISSPEAASRLRKGLRMHFREMLADISAHEKKLLISSTQSKRYKRYVALGILWPLQISASVTIIVLLVSQAEKVNRTFKTEYAQSLFLTLTSMIAPLSIPFLVQLEEWNPATSQRVVLLKLFSLRLVNVCTLFYRLYMALAQAAHVKAGNQILACTSHKGCPDGFACCNTNGGIEWVSCTPNQGQVCMPGCMENVVAKQLLRLMLANTFVSVAWDLVYGVICHKILKFSLRRFYEPMKKPYSASRTSNLTHGLLLLALILCSLPASATLVQKSSGVCGPIAENSSMYETLSDYIEETPTLFRVILQWLGNPAILMGLILLLVFALILSREKLVQTQFSFRARYKMFTTCCLLTFKQSAEQEKIRLLSKQVLDS